MDIDPIIAARLLPSPPANWRRPKLKRQTELQVILNQDSRCKVTGEKFTDIKLVRFDHRPPVYSRQYDPVANDTVPSVNDPDTIDAILVEQHNRRTFTDNGTGRGDLTHKAHVDRVSEGEGAHRIAMALKEPGRRRVRKNTIRGRGFAQRA